MTTDLQPPVDYVWQQLSDLLAGAEREVVLVAPFMKQEVVGAALEAVPSSVRDITLVTRWSAAEIAAGASDLAVLDLVAARPGARLLLRHDLHAKIYLVDQRCLVGSANLTGRATGRTADPNLELLVEVPADDPGVARVLAEALGGSVAATHAMAATIEEQADQLAARATSLPDDARSPAGGWLPVSRAPNRLFGVYRGQQQNIPETIRKDLLLDLARLDPPQGLDHADFNAFVARRLTSWPALRALDEAGTVTKEALENNVAELVPDLDNPAAAAETIVRWLDEFDPDVHIVQRGSYEIVRGRRVT